MRFYCNTIFFAGAFSGVQHVAGDAGKYQQDIPGSRVDSQGHWKPEAVNE